MTRSKELEQALRHPSKDASDEKGLTGYLEVFNLKIEELGKLILEVGSGVNENVAFEAGDNGIIVVSLNPSLVKQNDRRLLVTDLFWQRRSLAAIAQRLSIRDESFDSVISYRAIPMYIEPDEYQIVFSEFFRVLKTRGLMAVGPVLLTDPLENPFEDIIKTYTSDFKTKPIVSKLTGEHCYKNEAGIHMYPVTLHARKP